jgi:hypothetical protein
VKLTVLAYLNTHTQHSKAAYPKCTKSRNRML